MASKAATLKNSNRARSGTHIVLVIEASPAMAATHPGVHNASISHRDAPRLRT